MWSSRSGQLPCASDALLRSWWLLLHLSIMLTALADALDIC